MTSQRFYTSLQHIPRISHRQVGPCTESDRAQKQEIDFRSVFRIEKTTPDKERKYDHNVRNVFSIKIWQFSNLLTTKTKRSVLYVHQNIAIIRFVPIWKIILSCLCLLQSSIILNFRIRICIRKKIIRISNTGFKDFFISFQSWISTGSAWSLAWTLVRFSCPGPR